MQVFLNCDQSQVKPLKNLFSYLFLFIFIYGSTLCVVAAVARRVGQLFAFISVHGPHGQPLRVWQQTPQLQHVPTGYAAQTVPAASLAEARAIFLV